MHTLLKLGLATVGLAVLGSTVVRPATADTNLSYSGGSYTINSPTANFTATIGTGSVTLTQGTPTVYDIGTMTFNVGNDGSQTYGNYNAAQDIPFTLNGITSTLSQTHHLQNNYVTSEDDWWGDSQFIHRTITSIWTKGSLTRFTLVPPDRLMSTSTASISALTPPALTVSPLRATFLLHDVPAQPQASPVPEPSTALPMGLGLSGLLLLGGIGHCRYRRSQS